MYVFLWKLANLYTCNIYIFTAINKSIIYVLANVYIYIYTYVYVGKTTVILYIFLYVYLNIYIYI